MRIVLLNGPRQTVVLNASDQLIEFELPKWPDTGHWSAVLDTSSHPQAPDPSDKSIGSKLSSPAQSVLAFAGVA